MTTWNAVLKNVYQRHPFLCTLRCSQEMSFSGSGLPDLVRLTAASVLGLVQGPPASLLTIVVPRLYDTAFWVAYAVALQGMRGDYARAAATPHSFLSGDTLLLDAEHVVEFDEEKEGYLWFKTQQSTNARTRVKLAQRLRLQHTSTKRKRGWETVSTDLPPNLLDSLLETQACGNRNIYHNTTILVSGMHRTEVTARGLCVSSSASRCSAGSAFDLVQWGKIRQDGELVVTSSGQRKGDPVMLLASDLISVRDYLRAHPESRPLIVVDGTSRVCNRLDVLDDLAATGTSLVICGERSARADIDLLADRSPDLWIWSREDLNEFFGTRQTAVQSKPGNAFTDFDRATFNFTQREVEVESCHDVLLEEAYQQLSRVDARLKLMDRDTSALQRTLFNFLLTVSRALFPLLENDETSEMFAEKMDAAVSAASAASEWDEELAKVVDDLCMYLIDIPTRDDTRAGSKIAVLEKLLRSSYPDTVTILTASDWEEAIVQSYLYRRGRLVTPGRIRIRSISSLDVSAEGVQTEPSDRLIVCGWLNGERMHRLHELCFSPKIHLLLYPFEEKWYTSASRRWDKPINGEMTREGKARLLGIPPEYLPHQAPALPVPEPIVVVETDVYHEEFEQQIISGLRHAAARIRPGDDTPVSARLVFLSESYLACLTETHRVPVVTNFVQGYQSDSAKVPEKTVDQLKPGDFVIFRKGAAGDLIREYADLWLKKQGKGHLRDVAALWRVALREFRSANGGMGRVGLNQTVALLKAGGVARGEPAIKSWFDEDYGIIGPQDRGDLEAIAHVTGSASLQKQLVQVKAAIKEVRGAHLHAGTYLIKRLTEELQSRMQMDVGAGRLDFEVEGLGKAVVLRVEVVDQCPLSIPRNRVNRLLHEDEL